MGMTTAVGGGILRDMLLGLTPPAALKDPLQALVAIATSLLLFIVWKKWHPSGNHRVWESVLLAADSLGLARWQVYVYVILPQAVSTSMPAFMANVIFLLKETSVFSAISLMDLMFTAKDLIGLYYKTPECLFLLVVFYLIILLPVSLLGSWLERRVRYAGFGS